jgi:hypothetical protein
MYKAIEAYGTDQAYAIVDDMNDRAQCTVEVLLDEVAHQP